MTVFDELAEVLDGDVEGTGLILTILDSNARSTQEIMNRVQTWTEQERDEWKARALAAERRVEQMEQNVLSMLYRGVQ